MVADVADEIQERIKRYRKHAAEALAQAENAKPEQRLFFLRLAHKWLQLAHMLEKGQMD